MSTQHYPICMAEEYWANSYFSVARYYGGIQMNQYSYKIVNKEGITIFELSDPENEHYVGDGDEQAIKPGEPADLVRKISSPTTSHSDGTHSSRFWKPINESPIQK